MLEDDVIGLLSACFNAIENEQYVVYKPLREEDLIADTVGDVDIIVPDISSVVHQLQRYFDAKISDGSFSYKVTKGSGSSFFNSSHVHFDVFKRDKLEVRLDVIDDKSICRKLALKKNVLKSVFVDRKSKVVSGINYYECDPSVMASLMVAEFVVLFSDLPSKYKHFAYLENAIGGMAVFELMHSVIDQDKLLRSKFFYCRKKIIRGFVPSQVFALRELYRKIKMIGLKSVLVKMYKKIVL